MPNDPGWLSQWDYHLPWYHGSPYQIDTLLAGSTITQDKAVACVFSHKPQIVTLEDDPDALFRDVPRLRHNGKLAGLLYVIDEPLGPQDIFPHPHSCMPPGVEWLTCRPLRLRLLSPVEIDPAQILSPDDIEDLRRK